MPDYLDVLASDAMKSIEEGYYETSIEMSARPTSLKEAIVRCKRTPIICEIKFHSPSVGALGRNHDLKRIAGEMEEGGAVGISVLTEKKHFGGHVRFLSEARDRVKIPILMKDLVLSPVQIDCASRTGANAILLIQTLFDRGYCEKDVQSMIKHSHSRGLEVLLEAHTRNEFLSALDTDADMIGVNNRNLETLEVDLEVTKRILAEFHIRDKVIVSESGINSPQDIQFLRQCGAQAFLVGTAIMKAGNIKEKVKELVETL
ncbi:MAG: indole-3-glycerol-phosphate synthase [Nitrososphaerota archaeon]